MSLPPIIGLYPIIDTGLVSIKDIPAVAKEIISGGARVLQLRAKGLGARALMETALLIKEITERTGAALIINDRVDVALMTGAAGVHLGQEDIGLEDARTLLGPGAVIGISTHNPEEALRAARAGADYISLGPVFATSTKADARSVRGLEMLGQVARAVKEAAPEKDIPIVAIGGITEENVQKVLATGATSCAVISDILRAGDIRRKVASIIHAIESR